MVVADMPLLEVESNRAGSTCCKTCSKENVTHGKGGVFLCRGAARPLIFRLESIREHVG